MTNEQLLKIANNKAKFLPVNTQIRLTSEPKSLWLYNFGGSFFIGSCSSEPTELLFKNRSVYHISDKNNNIVARVQRLFID